MTARVKPLTRHARGAQQTLVGSLLLLRRDATHRDRQDVAYFVLAGPRAAHSAHCLKPRRLALHGPTLLRQLAAVPPGAWTAGWLLRDDEHADGRLWLMPADDEGELSEHAAADARLRRWISETDPAPRRGRRDRRVRLRKLVDTADLWDGLLDYCSSEPIPRTVSL
ncbi:hypothetical protein [Kineococcus terrestris]|uniref:hypothetical protein n=1 Tax=Kineococcus terrestris TaxID=2044856 RepID=UPI0034DB214D